MKDLRMSEIEHGALEAYRDSVADEKASLRNQIRAARTMMEFNTKEGRHEEANAAFAVMGASRKRLGQCEIDHAAATAALFKFWPHHAVPESEGGVVAKSGHR
jgi:hypothetical protein